MDTVFEQADLGIDELRSKVRLNLTAPVAVNVENATLLGADSLDAFGNALANVLTGNTATTR